VTDIDQPELDADPTDADSDRDSREDLRRKRASSKRIIVLLAVVAGIGGIFAGCHPTGTPVIDELYGGLFAVAVTLIASQASRESLLVLGAGCVAMSRDWLFAPALVAFGIAVYQVALPGSRRRMGALVGALCAQVILRWPPIGFHGSTALVAVVILIYPCVSAYRRLSRSGRSRTRRAVGTTAMVALVPLILLLAVWALSSASLSRGQQVSISALHDLRSGKSAQAAQKLQLASDDFASASSTVGSWWSSPLRLVPGFAQQRQALASGAVMAQHLDSVASREAPAFNLQSFSIKDGQIDLSKVTPLLAPAKVLNAALSNAQRTMAKLQSPWLVAPLQTRLRSLSAQLEQAHNSANLVVKTIPVLPAMLGADAPRHYLVVFQTPSEMRGLDGVITGYAELTAVNGKISMTASGPVGALNAALPAGGGTLTGPADFLARYGDFHPNKYFQDETYAPDLPTTGQVLAQLYPQAGGGQIDGVIVLDPFGLAQLLSLTGPVKVPGLPVPLTDKNTPSELMEDQYILYGNLNQGEIRNDYGAEALKVVFDRLTNTTLPSPAKVSKAISTALRGGRLGMWSSHPDEESVLTALHAADKFPSAHGGDVLAVTFQNSGNNKLDVFLHQSITDSVVYNSTTGNVTAKLNVALKNDAPSSGLPPVVINNLAAPQYPPGANYMLMSLYSPFLISDPRMNGQPFPMSTHKELGVYAYSAFVLVPSDATNHFTVTLTGAITPSPNYVMHLRVTPSANPISTTVTMSPSGNPGDVSTWNANSDVTQSHSFKG
jgi:hypothetical protein